MSSNQNSHSYATAASAAAVDTASTTRNEENVPPPRNHHITFAEDATTEKKRQTPASPRQGLPPRPPKHFKEAEPEDDEEEEEGMFFTDPRDHEDKNENDENGELIGADLVDSDGENCNDGDGGDDDDDDSPDAMAKKKADMEHQMNVLMKLGLGAFHELERLQQEFQMLKDDNQAKTAEILRLRKAESMKQETITNLYKAVEKAKTDTRQASRSVVTESTLRADLAKTTQEKNTALGTAATYQRRVVNLEEQNSQLKTKLTRITQEKFKLEREQRAAVSLARNMDQHAASDVEFYKRKVTELTGQIQSLNGTLLEKSRMIENMQQQLERSLSRQALAQRRAGDNKHRHA